MIKMQLYVCHTGVGREQKMIQQCQRSIMQTGEAIFSPIVERRIKVRGKEETIWRSLYPGYVFIETDKPQDFFLRLRFGLGKTVFGYLQVLRNDEYILPLEAEEEDLLRKMMDADHKVRMSYAWKLINQRQQQALSVSPGAVYDQNAKIVITQGPLTSLRGRIVRIDPHKKIAVVRTKFLGEDRNVVVGLELIRPQDPLKTDTTDKRNESK